jgi:hypothetical protein
LIERVILLRYVKNKILKEIFINQDRLVKNKKMKNLLSLFLTSCFLCFFYAIVAVLMPSSAFADNYAFWGYGFQSTSATAKVMGVDHTLRFKSAPEITSNPHIPGSIEELNILSDLSIDITDMPEVCKIDYRRETIKMSASETTPTSKVRSLSADVFSFPSGIIQLRI